MAILSKGATIVADTQVSATNLNNLVDAATFLSGAVDSTTTQLSGGAIIVKDGGITPAKISTGGPNWTSGGVVSATSFSGPLTGSITSSIDRCYKYTISTYEKLCSNSRINRTIYKRCDR
jgi:hypothetical protein